MKCHLKCKGIAACVVVYMSIVHCPLSIVHTSSDWNMGLCSSMLSCQEVARARAMFLLLVSHVLGTLSEVTWPRAPYVRLIFRGPEVTGVQTVRSQTQELHRDLGSLTSKPSFTLCPKARHFHSW